MKRLATFLLILTLTSCKQPTNKIAKLQNQIDSLKKELSREINLSLDTLYALTIA